MKEDGEQAANPTPDAVTGLAYSDVRSVVKDWTQ